MLDFMACSTSSASLERVLMQPGEHFALVHVGREIADQFGLSGIPSKFFN
jgi:hypothetical protein